jgi:hypothetical protein
MGNKRKFPVLWTLILVFSLSWLLNELGVISINVPWIPTILAIIAIAMIINRFIE